MGGDADRGQREHAVGDDRAEHAAGYLGGDVGERVAPADAAEARVGERDDRVEVPAGDWAEHEDDREQAGAVAAAFSNSSQADVVRGERLRRDPRADHERGKEGRAEQLGEQPAAERGRVAGGHRSIVLHRQM